MKIRNIIMAVALLSGLFGSSGLFSKTVWAQYDTDISIVRGINVIANPKPSFYVRVSVDHPDLIYEEGETLTATVTSSEAGYLYLVYQDAAKKMTLLYPNKFHKDNWVEENETLSIPEVSGDFRLRISAPFGEEKLLAVVSKKQLKSVHSADLSNNATAMDDAFFDAFKKAIVVEATTSEKPDVVKDEWGEHCLTIKTMKNKKDKPRTESEPRTRNESERFLVSIGIGDYKDSSIPKLSVCGDDADSIQKLFISKCNVPNKNTMILTDKQATLQKIHDVFCKALPSLTKPGDIVFVYWSGHGGRCADKNGDESDGFDEFLVPYDASRLDPETMLLDDIFGRWIQNLDGRKILFILDACNSGGTANTKSFDDDLDNPFDFGLSEISFLKDIGQNNVAVIASSSAGEVSLVRKENDLSVMTWYLIEAIENNPKITHEELFNTIKGKVSDYVKKNFYVNQSMILQDDLKTPLILNP